MKMHYTVDRKRFFLIESTKILVTTFLLYSFNLIHLMKKSYLLFLVFPFYFGCNSESKSETQEVNTFLPTDQVLTQNVFDINSLPMSSKDIGDFPFFTAPEGSYYINSPKVSAFDFIVFVRPDSIYPVEGKTFRSHVHPDKSSATEISSRYLNKSYEDALIEAGAVKIFEGKLNKDQIDKYSALATYAGSNGSLDIWNDEIVTYIIRREDGDVYFTMSKGGSNSTSIQVVQEKAFQQTIQKVTAEKIENDLLKSGKAILHINFDTDKATLTADGQGLVKEIIAVLKENADFKVAIHGYTDNSGSMDHNQKLSESRALAVKEELVKAGINPDRLSAKGYGQDDPIADNATEAGKAQNRRVELIKR